jgi:hypothetical protein
MHSFRKTTKYRYNTSLGTVLLNIGELAKYFFSWANASLHSSNHSKIFLKILKNGRHFSVGRVMNQFNAANFPLSCFVVFEDCISKTAWIFSGLASIPLFKTMYPNNFPKDTQKAHLVGFSLTPFYLSVLNASWRSCVWSNDSVLFTSMSST